MKLHLSVSDIQKKIFLIRNQKVMFDRDLAALYGVETFNLNKAVKRNLDRFPSDFMFRLTREEVEALRFQFGILKRGQHSKYLPVVFTREGVAMLSSVLRSKLAVRVNIEIMRAFIRFSRGAFNRKLISQRLEKIESHLKVHDGKILDVFDSLRRLMGIQTANKRKIGFKR